VVNEKRGFQALNPKNLNIEFNETPFAITQLMNGDIKQFDLEQLITLITKAGMEVRVEVVSKAA
jgi:hypothetical protein